MLHMHQHLLCITLFYIILNQLYRLCIIRTVRMMRVCHDYWGLLENQMDNTYYINQAIIFEPF